MSISGTIIRHSSSFFAPKPPDCSIAKTLLFSTCSSSMAAEKFMTLLEKNQPHVEKTLDSVKSKLDPKCIAQVLERCGADKPQLGMRFFIWAALHPAHRPTSYTYAKACELLRVEQNPKIIIDVMDKYRAEGSVLSIKMFKVVLNLCRAAKDANSGLLVLRKMKEFNCRPDTVTYNVVIRLLVGDSRLDEAVSLMREMGLIDLYPDMITYVSIIKGLCDAGRLEDACGLVKAMKGHGCVPNAVVYSTLLDGICSHGSLEMASEFLSGMEKDEGECKPNLVTYTTIIKSFVEKGKSMEALRVLNRMDDFGIRPNKVTFTTILDGLCREGLVEEAREVIEKFNGDELYSLFVVSLMRAGKGNESEKVFRMMMSSGMRPSGLASGSVVMRVISEGRVLDGFLLFDSLEKSTNLVGVDSEVYSGLLDGLCRENCFAEARRVVDVMVGRKVRLKPSHAEIIIERLNRYGEHDLASCVLRVSSVDLQNMS